MGGFVKKIAVLQGESNLPVKNFWLEELKLPLQWLEIESTSPEELLQRTDFDALLFDQELSDQILPLATRAPAEIVETGMADSLIREREKVWLRCFVRESLRLLIMQKAASLDTHAVCYITGTGGLARMAAVVASQLGYQKMILVAMDREKADLFCQNLQKLFFGLSFEILQESELTLQPNNGSLLLNTAVPDKDPEIMEDLTYLNYLKKDGLVVDLPNSFLINSLMEEAIHVGIRTLPGSELWAARDFLFLKSLLRDSFKLTSAEYLAAWISFNSSENKT